MASPDDGVRVSKELLAYYAAGREAERLEQDTGPLERARTRVLLQRYLPPPPARVLDVGGAAGAYAFWLTDAGYEVHLLDPVAVHIERAQARSAARPERPLARAWVGDARSLDAPDRHYDAVLMLGPLYHLPERADRLQALREAHRVLRPGGRLFAAAISRYASLLDGLRRDMLLDPAFMAITEDDLATGRHVNPTSNPQYFTTAFFHRPEELAADLEDGEFRCEDVLAVEGPGWLLQDFAERWQQADRRRALLRAIELVEREPALLGASAHLLAVGKKA